MSETAVRFGRHDHLTGVLTLPETAAVARPRVAVVLPNAGFVHHIGPFRLHVHLARAFARRGIASIRFDLSGLGDSEVSPDRQPIEIRKQHDIDDAMTLLESHVPDCQIALAGLCSGASDAHNAALAQGSRVAAVAMLDPAAYPTKMYYAIEALRRITSPRRMARYLWRRLKSNNVPDAATDSGVVKVRQANNATKTNQQFANELAQVTGSGARYLFVYTAGRQYNHRRQLYTILTPETDASRISVIHYPQCDHTFLLRSHRKMACKAVTRWLAAHFS